MSIPKSFGAVELAKYCQVSRNTIHNWIRNPKIGLKAFKLPGGHYRVEKKELIKFLKNNEMPIPDELFLEEPKTKVLIVNEVTETVSSISQILKKLSDDMELEVVSNGIEACIKVGTFLPELMVIDTSIPRMDGVEVCKEIKRNSDLSGTKILVLSEDSHLDTLKEIGVDSVILKPVELKSLEKELKRLLKE
ncbi:MAG TPA: response regulator [Candidatus Eremiobacteraeota bacterium]|nr:MAG: Transcriptional regulatory protein YycF [bacterium ADurb.Bin363]HPZ09604.1 response regulator [Candidatus Eremiobacteraeota bacterium]